MVALAQLIDTKVMALYKDIPYKCGAAATTPDALEDFAALRRIFATNRVPGSNRNLVFDPSAGSKFGILDAVVGADKSGSTAALREANFGRILTLDTYESQNVPTHTAGAYAALEDVTVTDGEAGDTAIELTSAAGTSTDTLLAGDLLTIDGHDYVVTATTAAAVAGVIAAVAIYPALHADYDALEDDSVTFTATHVANLGFHRNAFALCMRPLAPARGAGESYTLDFQGLSIRVTFGYSMDTKTDTVSFDCLYGVKTLYPELAVRLLG